jgi:hypothetical protein
MGVTGTCLRHQASADFGEKERTLGKIQEISNTGGGGCWAFPGEIDTTEVKV